MFYVCMRLLRVDSFWMDNTYCTGGETNLTDCRFDGWGVNDCHETEAAGVVCESGPISRLVDPDPVLTTTVAPTTTTVSSASRTSTSTSSGSVARKLQQDMAPRMRIKVYK